MRLFHLALKLLPIVVLGFCILADLARSQTQTQSPTPVSKDPQAISLLTQSLNAVGGLPAVSVVQDYTGTGIITYNWADQPVQAPATVQGMGIANFRVDSTLSNGVETWVCSGNSGALISPDGTSQPIPFYNLATAGSMSFPYMRIASTISDSTTNISYIGMVKIDGQQAYQIHFSMAVTGFLPASSLANLPGLGNFDFYVDPTSLLVTRLIETVRSDSNFNTTFTHELDFTNYQAAGGIQAPFTISETINGQTTWSITLSSLTFNSGLTVATFNPQPSQE